jgi:hypothetical protein
MTQENEKAAFLRILQKAYAREAKGKPPLVARYDRHIRRTGTSKFWRAVRRFLLSLAGEHYRVAMKWRWCRGEIRDRRYRASWTRRMAQAMTPPLRRFRDYSAIGRKAFQVEPLESKCLPYYSGPAHIHGELIQTPTIEEQQRAASNKEVQRQRDHQSALDRMRAEEDRKVWECINQQIPPQPGEQGDPPNTRKSDPEIQARG